MPKKRATKVGINLDVYDAFGNKRPRPLSRFSKAKTKKQIAFDPYQAARQLQRLIPRSEIWSRMGYGIIACRP